jgi:hypothetical protein
MCVKTGRKENQFYGTGNPFQQDLGSSGGSWLDYFLKFSLAEVALEKVDWVNRFALKKHLIM